MSINREVLLRLIMVESAKPTQEQRSHEAINDLLIQHNMVKESGGLVFVTLKTL